MSTELATKNEKEIVYKVGEDEVKLTASIVQQFIKRGNKDLSNTEIFNFIQLCKYRKLNPFLNEAYPVKFGNEAAQMIVSKEAFMNKANNNPNYQGHQAGIIVVRDGEVLELEGSFKLPTDSLVGGWAKVFVKGKEAPIVAKVSMSEYNKGHSTWKNIPCTMIRKTALVQALREAFPHELNAMYVSEEMGVDETKIEVTKTIPREEKAEEVEEVEEVIDVEFDEPQF